MLPTISKINIVPLPPNKGLIGFTSFIIDERWYVSNIAIYSRLNGGIRLVYPAKKLENGIQSVFNPINKQTGEYVEQLVQEKINELWNTDAY